MFCYQVRKTIASMAAALGGLDALVFTGGIGEHAQPLREEICQPLAFLGRFAVSVLPAQEDFKSPALPHAKLPRKLAQCRARFGDSPISGPAKINRPVQRKHQAAHPDRMPRRRVSQDGLD